MQGQPERSWRPYLSPDLIDDLQDYLTAKQLRLKLDCQPWEVEFIPLYWLWRYQLFEQVLKMVQKGNESLPDDEELEE